MADERGTDEVIAFEGHVFIFDKTEVEWTEEMALKAQKIMAIYHRHKGEVAMRLKFAWNEEFRDWFKK